MNEPDCNWIELIKFGGQAIFIMVGWVVVNALSKKREKDKFRNEIIVKSLDALCDLIDKLFDTARAYHLRSERDQDTEVKIRMSLQDLGFRVAGLKDLTGHSPEYFQCEVDVIQLRQAITLNHFEDDFIEVINVTSEIFQKMAESSLAAKRNLIALKHMQFSIK